MIEKAPIEQKDTGVLIRVRVQPRASRETLCCAGDGLVRAYTTAPPVDNAANSAVCALIARSLGVGKKRVTLVSGAASRNKTLFVSDMDVRLVAQRLARPTGK